MPGLAGTGKPSKSKSKITAGAVLTSQNVLISVSIYACKTYPSVTELRGQQF